MINSLKAFFEQFSAEEDDNSAFSKHDLACAALLIEVALADDEFSDIERKTLESILATSFHIPGNLSHELIACAEQEVNHAVDHFQFTKHINDHYDYAGRLKVLSSLWQLAYADNHLDRFEEHRIRRISDLLFIDHSDFIRLKHNARDQ